MQNYFEENTDLSKEIVIEQDTAKTKKIEINGVYEGYAKDKKMYLIINNFDGKKFYGYSVIYWNPTKGVKAEFDGYYDESKDIIYINESSSIKGSGKFEGKLKKNRLEGNWYRYSDNGSYNWKLQKVTKTESDIVKENNEMEILNLAEKEKQKSQKKIDEQWMSSHMVRKLYSPYNQQLDCSIKGISSQNKENYFTFDFDKMIFSWKNASVSTECYIIFTGTQLRKVNDDYIEFLYFRAIDSRIGIKGVAFGRRNDNTISYLQMSFNISECFLSFVVTSIE